MAGDGQLLSCRATGWINNYFIDLKGCFIIWDGFKAHFSTTLDLLPNFTHSHCSKDSNVLTIRRYRRSDKWNAQDLIRETRRFARWGNTTKLTSFASDVKAQIVEPIEFCGKFAEKLVWIYPRVSLQLIIASPLTTSIFSTSAALPLVNFLALRGGFGLGQWVAAKLESPMFQKICNEAKIHSEKIGL